MTDKTAPDVERSWRSIPHKELQRIVNEHPRQAAEIERLRVIERAARIFITQSYRPEAPNDAMRFDVLAAALGEDND